MAKFIFFKSMNYKSFFLFAHNFSNTRESCNYTAIGASLNGTEHIER